MNLRPTKGVVRERSRLVTVRQRDLANGADCEISGGSWNQLQRKILQGGAGDA
jgi:hypothetical protein